MKSNLFIFSYLFSNAFRTFCMYLFFEAFFEKPNGKSGKILCYVLNYIVVSAEYLWIDIPLLTLLLNIIFDVWSAFFYEANWKRRIVGITFRIGILDICEAVVIVLTGFFPFSMVKKGYYSSEVGMFCYPILPLILVLLYRRLKKSRGDIRFPLSYCIIVVCVPLSCIYLIFMLFSFRDIQTWQMLSAVVLLFAMFVSVLLLYEKQIKFYSEENRRQVLEVQNSYYKKQMEYMVSTENITRSLRHDIKNHLLSISALAQKNDDLPVMEYTDKLYHYFQPSIGNVSSGNIIIDSILNGKRALASEKGIDLRMEVAIPAKLLIHDVDMTILLGNLLDNAIENFDSESGEAVELEMRYDRGRLFIRLANPYSREGKVPEGDFRTRKKDKKNHGFGLQNIRSVVAKYNGEMNIENRENIFLVEILLYLSDMPQNLH